MSCKKYTKPEKGHLKTIKYPNRKLYDIGESNYTTLTRVGERLMNDPTLHFQSVDFITGEDITEQTKVEIVKSFILRGDKERAAYFCEKLLQYLKDETTVLRAKDHQVYSRRFPSMSDAIAQMPSVA